MKAIIIGASSGIGRELAKILSKNNCSVGLAARNIEKLVELQKELPGDSYVRSIPDFRRYCPLNFNMSL